MMLIRYDTFPMKSDEGTAVAVVSEIGGNNSFATAQDLTGSFTVLPNPNVTNSFTRPSVTVNGVGNGATDWFKFTLNTPGQVIFDIDEGVKLALSSVNAWVRLYNANNQLIAENNNSLSVDAGSFPFLGVADPFLNVPNLAAGSYYVQVGRDVLGSFANLNGAATYKLNITIPVQNVAPNAADDVSTTDEDSALVVDVLGNDTDDAAPKALTITAASITEGSGTLSIAADKLSLSYDPGAFYQSLAAGEMVTVKGSYTVADAQGATDTGSVEITVTGVNDGPTAFGDTAKTDEDTPVEILVLGNDTDPDATDDLMVTSVTILDGGKGTLNVVDGTSLSFDPGAAYQWLAAGEAATLEFTYTVADGNGGEALGFGFVLIAGLNDGPTAGDDTATTDEDTPVEIDVLANDTDADLSDSLTVTGASIVGMAGGSVTVADDGKSITFDPGKDFQFLTAGDQTTVEITYEVEDGQGGSDTASVEVTVTGANDAPIIVASVSSEMLGSCDPGFVLGPEDLLATDVDGGTITYTLTSLPIGRLLVRGEVAAVGATFTQADIDAGKVAYLAGPVGPSGFNSFAFVASDGQGGETPDTFEIQHAFAKTQIEPIWGGYWGGDENELFIGTAATDNMSGGNGCDVMIGDDGDDQLHGGEGNNRAFGGKGTDNLTGAAGNDLLDGGDGDDQVHANGGDNIAFGGAGADNITSGEGSDRAWGGDGNDTIHAGAGNNRIDAGEGDDHATTGAGNDVFIGGTGNDTVYDGGGANKFKLGGIAGAPSDGDDGYWAGSGADKFALYLDDRAGSSAGWGDDTIHGFRIGEGDQLVAFNDVAGFWDDAEDIGALVDSGFVSGARTGDGGDLVLTFGSGAAQSSVTLKWFFWDNAWFIQGDARSTPFGEVIARDALVSLLQVAVQDGGDFGVSGPDVLAKGHDYISSDFMI